jgi:hypothetical protein
MLSRRAVLALALIAACDRGARDAAPPPPPLPPTTAPAPTPPPAAASCSLAPIPLKAPITPKRLVAIGDLHGDLAAARAALRAAKVVDDSDRWTGGETVVVQTGDILDRGDDEPQIYELLERLQDEATKAGGAIILLNGNHELMNTARDFRYVTPEGLTDFGDRQLAFDPGGVWAKRLAKNNIVAIVGDTAFSHAGIVPAWASRVDEANRASRCWLDGQAGGPTAPPDALTSDDSPVWTRAYGFDAVDCGALADALTKLGAARMVVGHTPQQRGITSACDGKLWRVDVGLAKYYGGPIEVLELGATPRVLRGTRL